MCRNIKTLFNFDPPARDEEIRAACRLRGRRASGPAICPHAPVCQALDGYYQYGYIYNRNQISPGACAT